MLQIGMIGMKNSWRHLNKKHVEGFPINGGRAEDLSWQKNAEANLYTLGLQKYYLLEKIIGTRPLKGLLPIEALWSDF